MGGNMRKKLLAFYAAHLSIPITTALLWDMFTRLFIHPFPHEVGEPLIWWKFLFYIPTGVLSIPATVSAFRGRKWIFFACSLAVWILIIVDATLYFIGFIPH